MTAAERLERNQQALNELYDVVERNRALPMDARLMAAVGYWFDKYVDSLVSLNADQLLALRERRILEPIAARHSVTVAEIKSKSRIPEVVRARDEVRHELLAAGWTRGAVARAVGGSREDAARGARRHRALMAAGATRKVASR
jgi:hypothetical protein